MKRQRQRGSSLVEMAVVAPLMAMLLLGTIWSGYSFYAYNQLEKAVHDGARYASTRTLLMTTEGTNNFVNEIRNVAIYGTPTETGAPVMTNMKPCNIHVRFEPPTAENPSKPCDPPAPPTARPTAIHVEVSNYYLPGVFGAVQINKPSTRFPYVGRAYRQP